MYKFSLLNFFKNAIYLLNIFIRNYLSFIAFFLYKKFITIKAKTNIRQNNTILFFNSGQYGDLLISSIIIENEEHLPNNCNYLFLIKEGYKNLFEGYKGKFEIITYNISKYRYSIKYKIDLIKRINSIGIKKLYNLTASRGILTEELCYLINANEKYALNYNSFYLDKLLLSYFNKYYSNVYFDYKVNEYKKTIKLVKIISNKNNIEFNIYNNKLFDFEIIDKGFIVVSPLSSVDYKNWDFTNYNYIIQNISKENIVYIVGTELKINIPQSKNVKNLVGKTSFYEAAQLIAHCKLFIGNDSGLMHLAVKFGKPFVGIFGGGAYNRFLPYITNKNQKYYTYNMPCLGCEWICNYKEKYCLNKIDKNNILIAIQNILVNC